MKHIFLIDNLDKLTIAKDSTLLLASYLKENGYDVYLLFERNLYFSNELSIQLNVSSFEYVFKNEYYLDEIVLGDEFIISVSEEDIIHMRFDPPFDQRYLQTLWILQTYELHGLTVMNSPRGILLNHEKITAYTQNNYIGSYIGKSEGRLIDFLEFHLSKGIDSFVVKPLDLFQGIGVEKKQCSNDKIRMFLDYYKTRSNNFSDYLVVQPFIKSVIKGEVRSLFFKGHHLGSISKVPATGEFVSNIAQGATFNKTDLSDDSFKECKFITQKLLSDGVSLVAFDILDNKVSEVNITCPGLINEVSKANNKNIILEMIKIGVN